MSPLIAPGMLSPLHLPSTLRPHNTAKALPCSLFPHSLWFRGICPDSLEQVACPLSTLLSLSVKMLIITYLENTPLLGLKGKGSLLCANRTRSEVTLTREACVRRQVRRQTRQDACVHRQVRRQTSFQNLDCLIGCI